jgi:hypothetical protein
VLDAVPQGLGVLSSHFVSLSFGREITLAFLCDFFSFIVFFCYKTVTLENLVCLSVTMALHFQGGMVPIRGLELVQRLQTMVQVASRAKHRTISEQFGSEIIEDLRPFGLETHAGEAFDFFRKWRRDDISMKKMEEAYLAGSESFETLKTVERDGRDPWLRIPLAELTELFDRRRGSFDFYVNEFNNMKSKATHVSAVFRPFQDRFVNEWSNYLDTYPTEQARKKIGDLNSELIGDKVELHIWAASVYDLFKFAAVYNPAFEQKQASQGSQKFQKRLPQGMISSTSERIYGQQWRLWLRENEDEISQFLTQTQEVVPEMAQVSASPRAKEVFSNFESERPDQLDEISIQATVLGAPELTSTQSWTDGDYSDSDLGDWLGLLQDAWALDKELLQITLRFRSNLKSSELTLRPSGISDAVTAVTAVIKRRS